MPAKGVSILKRPLILGGERGGSNDFFAVQHNDQGKAAAYEVSP